MAFSESTIISHPPHRVFEGLISREFHQHVSDELHARLETFEVTPAQPSADQTVALTSARSIEGERIAHRLPSAVQRFIKGAVSVQQQEAWSAAAADGSRDANVTITVPLAKATGTATIKLVASADGASTTVETNGSVKSNMPLVGSKIAQLAEPQVGRILTTMTKKLDAWLAQH